MNMSTNRFGLSPNDRDSRELLPLIQELLEIQFEEKVSPETKDEAAIAFHLIVEATSADSDREVQDKP